MLWKRQPHTEGKHLVLQSYLQAWLPIVGSQNERILFVDGFAGPGEYEGGEEGSPLVAMRSFVEHASRQVIVGEVVFVFIEQDSERAKHLGEIVAGWRSKLPQGAKAHVIEGAFDLSMTGLLDQLDKHNEAMAPAFVMIDPFGVKGTPMQVVRRILGNPQCEVYVTFMWESINRFLDTPEFETHLTDLFGTSEWKQASGLEAQERRTALYELYERQLRGAGAKQVVHFHLYEGDRRVYSIFFGTGHHRGSDRMKAAIWKIAPFGDFTFRGRDQLTLGVEPDYKLLREDLMQHFRGKGWVSIEEVLEFVASDATAFHTAQVKKPVLKPMEEEGWIEVARSTRTRRWSYPDGCKLRFDGPAPSLQF